MATRGDQGGCVIIGGGCHALMLIDCLQASGDSQRLAILDRDPARKGTRVAGVEVIGNDDLLPGLVGSRFTHFAVGLGTRGRGAARQRLFDLARAAGLSPRTVRHPSARVSQLARIADGAQLLPAAVVNAEARIGANAIVNSGAVVEHHCTIGAHAHVASGAVLGGAVTVGAGALVGAGATVLPCVRIGRDALVGAGAVVTADVPEGATVKGAPARTAAPGADSDVP